VTLSADMDCQLIYHVFRDEIDRSFFCGTFSFFELKVMTNCYIFKSISELFTKNQDGS